MKTYPKVCGLLLLAVLPLVNLQAQTQPASTASAVQTVLPQPETGLPKFDLDFSGGSPAQLVLAMEKGLGRPVNVVIPADFPDVKMPALKMRNVDVQQVFRGLNGASFSNQFGFFTQDKTVTAESVWSLQFNRGYMEPGSDNPRFYPLAAFLAEGLSVSDITTAIETGWRMKGLKELPKLSYHKETKLLIAVGLPQDLRTIDDVLRALTPPKEAAKTQAPAQK